MDEEPLFFNTLMKDIEQDNSKGTKLSLIIFVWVFFSYLIISI